MVSRGVRVESFSWGANYSRLVPDTCHTDIGKFKTPSALGGGRALATYPTSSDDKRLVYPWFAMFPRLDPGVYIANDIDVTALTQGSRERDCRLLILRPELLRVTASVTAIWRRHAGSRSSA